MKREFIIKMQGRQFEKGRIHIYIMILCFVITMIILMIYSSKYFVALLAPLFWILLRLKNISSEKNYMTDVICEITCEAHGLYVTLSSTQSRFCKSFFLDYNKVQCAQIAKDGKISISFITADNKKEIWNFYSLTEDNEFWKNEMRKFNYR